MQCKEWRQVTKPENKMEPEKRGLAEWIETLAILQELPIPENEKIALISRIEKQTVFFKTERQSKEDRAASLFTESGLFFKSRDKRIGCSKGGGGGFRPDFIFDAGTHFVVVEVDEHQHKCYDADNESLRMMSVQQALGLPVVFVRYNPDKYRSGDDSRLWNDSEREVALIAWVKRLWTAPAPLCVEVLYLFYDGFVTGAEPVILPQSLLVTGVHMNREGETLIQDMMMAANVIHVGTSEFSKSTDEFAKHAALYKFEFGIDRLSREFLDVNGYAANNYVARVALIAVCGLQTGPEESESDAAIHVSTVDMERAAIMGRVCETLGLLSIFDDDTEFDIAALTPKLKALPYFKDGNGFTAFARAFADANTVVKNKKAPPAWEHVGFVVKTLNVMFAFMGLKVRTASEYQKGGRNDHRVRYYTHKLCSEGVSKLKYLVRLKARGMKMRGILNEHARAVVSEEYFGPWESNVDRERLAQNPWRFVGPA